MTGVRRVRWSQSDETRNEPAYVHPADDVYASAENPDPEPNGSNPHVMQHHPEDTHDAAGQQWGFPATHNFAAHTTTGFEEEDDVSDVEDDDSAYGYDDDEIAFNQFYARNHSISAAPAEITHERLEWQQMLQSVLMGEVIKSEKKRLSNTEHLQQQKPIQEIWIALRALLRGRTVAEEQKSLTEGRKEVDDVLKMVMDFRVSDSNHQVALREVAEVLKNVDRIESLYPTRADMIHANPKYGEPEFQTRLDALNSWCTITRSLHMQYKILTDWTGSEDLQIARKHEMTDQELEAKVNDAPVSPYLHVQRTDPSFVERLLKESALQDTFDRRTLSALYLLLSKSKQTMVANSSLFEEMNLPPFISQLQQLASFPSTLVEEALKLRLEYKDRMNQPPKQMVDAMMEDYRGLLTLGCRVKYHYEELAQPAPGWKLKSNAHTDECYDAVLLESARFYFKLINWKLAMENENSLKECEILDKEWEFLKGTVCQAIEKANWECAVQFCSLTNSLLGDVMRDYISNLKIQPESVEGGIEIKYTNLLHTMRMRARKLLQFARFFMGQFENAAEYMVDTEHLDPFVTCLVESDHFLVYSGSFEEERVYIIASPSLYGRPDDIRKLTQACFACDKNLAIPDIPMTNSESDDYLLILSPWQDIMWTGEVVDVDIPYVHLGLKTKRVRLVTGDAKNLQLAKSGFWGAVQHSGIEVIQEHRAHMPKINKELYKIKMTVFKLADSTISSVGTIREQTQGLKCQELVEECFSFASDFGIRTARFLELAVRLQMDLKLVRLAIDWICFITDDCNPSDRKTFRWAVAALEFGHMMTRGVNILALNEGEFATLQTKVARCIALLISHFDVLGTRWTYELQKEEQQRRRGVTSKRNSYMSRYADDKDNITTSSTFGAANDTASASGGGITYIRDEWMRKITELEEQRNAQEQERKIVGKILDDQKPEDQSLVFLAPSSSNISFRWQQGRFIGAGTFGSVYLAINLDTSSVMAVKEIRFPDSSALSTLHKAIKEEMKVMEMLNHRNIVQYFGMEVHRDKVYIFMEYCENGSLGSLLEHGGRIEDELYIVDYAYQLLSGLAYLHENNIVHRDIKPDNILIDYEGQLKLSDFGAAKITAKGQKTMGRTTMNMNVNSLAGTPMYMAPEVITGGDTGRKGSMDIWSLGCCIVQMATGRRPWSTLENEWSVMYHVVTGHPPLPDPSQLSASGIDFLKKCFTRNPMKRPTAHELLDHPWIQEYLNSYNGEETQLPPITEDDHAMESYRSQEEPPTSIRSFDRPLVRSINNTSMIEGMAGSFTNSAQAQTYFREVAAQNTNDIPCRGSH